MARYLVDEATDALYTTTACETTDCWLGDALNVVTQHFPVAFGTTLAQALATLATARHAEGLLGGLEADRSSVISTIEIVGIITDRCLFEK